MQATGRLQDRMGAGAWERRARKLSRHKAVRGQWATSQAAMRERPATVGARINATAKRVARRVLLRMARQRMARIARADAALIRKAENNPGSIERAIRAMLSVGQQRRQAEAARSVRCQYRVKPSKANPKPAPCGGVMKRREGTWTCQACGRVR